MTNGLEISTARIYFVTGCQRSGTTVTTQAIASALDSPALTLADLSRFLPPLRQLLDSLSRRPTPLDRMVDGRLLSEATLTEYGPLLFGCGSSRRSVRFRPNDVPAVQQLADVVAARESAGIAVMKNPWDTGNEQALLAAFPTARVVIVRRRLIEIEASMAAAFARKQVSYDYLKAQLGESRAVRAWSRAVEWSPSRLLLAFLANWRLRITVARLAVRVQCLPLDRVALLSYDELVCDASRGASWSAHLVDATALADEFCAHYEASDREESDSSRLIARVIDWYWARSWAAVRERQRLAGLIGEPAALPVGRGAP